MAKTKSKTKLSAFSRFSKTQLIVAGIFILGFGAFGIWKLAFSSAATCTSYIYGYGGSGSCVKNIQILANYKLRVAPNRYGYLPQLAEDGYYGSKTKGGIVAIQKEFSLAQDGKVGPATWRILCSPHGGSFDAKTATAARNSGC